MVENWNWLAVFGENHMYRFNSTYPAIWAPFVGHGRMDVWNPYRVFFVAFKNMRTALQLSFKTSGWNTKNTYLVPLKVVSKCSTLTQLWILDAWSIFFLNSMEPSSWNANSRSRDVLIDCHWLVNVGSAV